MKIGTHDSITGEKGIWWAKVLTPFARTQCKTLVKQLEAGCTLFDIRVKRLRGVWRGAHGIWYTKRTAWDLLYELAIEAKRRGVTIRLTLTYEGRCRDNDAFLEFVDNDLWFLHEMLHVRIGTISTKYGSPKGCLERQVRNPFVVDYDILRPAEIGWLDGSHIEQHFLPLDGKHWQTYLPVPRLWKQFYFRKVEFNDDVYRVVDFL